MRPLLIGRGPWAQKVAAALGEMRVEYTLVGKMMAADAIWNARKRGNDSIIIASATSSHGELLEMAMRLNLPVFCEKPLVSSVYEMRRVQETHQIAGCPLVLCNYVHAWTEGFEHLWNECKGIAAAPPWPPPRFTATFGGDVQHADCHPVWDYGCHPLAMAVMLGVNVENLKLKLEAGRLTWRLSNEHVSIDIHAGPQTTKAAHVALGDWCTYDNGLWQFSHGASFKNSDAPPLQRALKDFFEKVEREDPIDSVPGRYGLEVSAKVISILESLCPSAGVLNG